MKDAKLLPVAVIQLPFQNLSDNVAWQKLGGINFSYFVLKQLPVIPPDRYTAELLDFVVPKVVELT